MANAPARRAGWLLVGLASTTLVVSLCIGGVVAGVFAATSPALFGTVTGAALVVLAGAGLTRYRIGRRLPRRFVVSLDLDTLPLETPPSAIARLFTRPAPLDLRACVEALERVAADPRVRGLLVDLRIRHGGLAQVQELREALQRVREAGTFTIAFADTFGELGDGNAAYYLASACEEVVLQPGGSVGLVGIAREANFLAGALTRLGVEALFEGRHEYKSAPDRLLRDGLSDADREQGQRLVDSLLDQIVRGVAAGRGRHAEEIRALVERGPLLGEEALAEGLIDRLGHADEAEARARERGACRTEPVPLARYARASRAGRGAMRRASRVALITATGNLVRSSSGPLPMPGGPPLDANALAATIRRAAQSRRTRAILLRIDSPGGSAVASETVHRALISARESGTPVVASLGNVAASGGYYLASAADRIVAQPGTITGSIGVFAGKLVVTGAKAQLGITSDEVHAGAHALISSMNRPFSTSEHERFAAALDAVYDLFVARVASGRAMTSAQVDAVARGRIWTGEDACANGLVDVLGGCHEALIEVRHLLGLREGARLRLVREPRRRSRPGLLLFGGATRARWQEVLQAALHDAAPVRLPPGGGDAARL